MPPPHAVDPIDRWLLRVRAGEAGAFGRALLASGPYLRAVANDRLPGKLRSKCDTGDLVQETFLAAWRHAGAFHGASAGELLAWLTEILRCRVANLRRDFLRTAKRRVSREVPLDVASQALDPEGSPDAQAARREDARLVELAVTRLPEDCRRVVVLLRERCRSLKEVAGVVGCAPAEARRLWRRAVAQMARPLHRATA